MPVQPAVRFLFCDLLQEDANMTDLQFAKAVRAKRAQAATWAYVLLWDSPLHRRHIREDPR